MKIFIDAGHNYNGADTGAQGNGLKEQEITFLIAKRLKVLLEADGHSVKMSRNNLTDNVGSTVSESINSRAKMSNDWGADLFVSIHCNAYDGRAKGTETLVYSMASKAVATAKRVQKALIDKLEMGDRGVKERPNLGVLRLTNAPALLVETAFIDNPSDSQKLSYRSEEFAEAIFEGITEKCVAQKELTEINDIVCELSAKGIITEKELWFKKLENDQNAYWLARKCVNYIRGIDV